MDFFIFFFYNNYYYYYIFKRTIRENRLDHNRPDIALTKAATRGYLLHRFLHLRAQSPPPFSHIFKTAYSECLCVCARACACATCDWAAAFPHCVKTRNMCECVFEFFSPPRSKTQWLLCKIVEWDERAERANYTLEDLAASLRQIKHAQHVSELR